MLEEYMKKTEPEYYPPVENLLDLIYEHYTENSGRQSSQGKREGTGEVASRAGWYGSIGRGLRWPGTSLGENHGSTGECVLRLGEDSI